MKKKYLSKKFILISFVVWEIILSGCSINKNCSEHDKINFCSDQKVHAIKKNSIKNDYEFAYANFLPEIIDIRNIDLHLMLIDSKHILPENHNIQIKTFVPFSKRKMEIEAGKAYNKMYYDAKNEGIRLNPVSAFRSVTLQRKNFKRKIKFYQKKGYDKVNATKLAAQIIQIPGGSEHNAGLGVDINMLTDKFEQKKEFKWLVKNAPKYGFILRYTKHDQDITGVTYEPWHWRYVGLPHSLIISKTNMSFEKYYSLYRTIHKTIMNQLYHNSFTNYN